MLVVDASVALKFVVDEDGREEAFARIKGEPDLTAPDWLLIEAGNVLWRKSLNGAFDQSVANDLLAAIPRFFEGFQPSSTLASKALALSFEMNHWIYDCVYLATAIDLGVPVLTADRKFWNAARRSGHGEHVELLTWGDGKP